MPGRQSHGAPPSKKPKARVKSKKRVLDAFSIASHQNPDKIKVRQNRLGTSEGGNRSVKKRERVLSDEDDEELESQPKKQRKGSVKGRLDELDVDEGSDSEGNTWKLGQVDSDDNSDIESDEAFGESDDERFEGFTFGGSSKKKREKMHSNTKGINLDEADEDSSSELSDDSLGSEAIDLATMLDQEEEDSSDEPSHTRRELSAGATSDHGSGKYTRQESEDTNSVRDIQGRTHRLMPVAEDSDSNESDESDGSDDESSFSSAEEDETIDPTKIAAMHEMIRHLPQSTELGSVSERRRIDDGFEYKNPSRIGAARTKLVFDDSTPSQMGEGRGRKTAKPLAAPIAKRQQDRLDRSVAYDKTKQTLEQWTDTVKHNRRAEHLIFPLPDNDLASAHTNTRLQPTGLTKPFNELEATIQSILEESGLAAANGKDDEDRIRDFEELEAKKMSIEEVKARRDQLRMARELLFREETKAKRIKKIKSKSYRKVHRKQREKEERLNKEALAEGGFAPSEDEIEAQDRRRAEERMGARHRGSKWAKATRETGRAAWDEDARAGVTEMAKRDEELRKRIEGRTISHGESGADSNEDEYSTDSDEDDEQELLRRLSKVQDEEVIDISAPGGKLANMKFMLKAQASRKSENDAMIEDIKKDLAGDSSSSENDEDDVGRRIFGPGSHNTLTTTSSSPQNEFEEQTNSGDNELDSKAEMRSSSIISDEHGAVSRGQLRNNTSKASRAPVSVVRHANAASDGGAWSNLIPKSGMTTAAEARKRRKKIDSAVETEELDLAKAAIVATHLKPEKAALKSSTVFNTSFEDNSSGDDESKPLPFALRDQELIKRAFAGADVVGEFEAEKKQTIEDEEEKVIDNTLPGWGSWTGDGLSKKAKARNKGKVFTKSEGIAEKNRKDRKLDRVIINEKRVKKNDKYLASTLPHPFESRQQYERSLRLPIGPEWATKETFQDATKPRILLKQGIIAPMSKPLL